MLALLAVIAEAFRLLCIYQCQVRLLGRVLPLGHISDPPEHLLQF